MPNPFVICSWIYAFCLNYTMVYTLRFNCNKDAHMHEQTTKEFGKMNVCITRFGIRIRDRKYLNEYNYAFWKCKPVPSCIGFIADLASKSLSVTKNVGPSVMWSHNSIGMIRYNMFGCTCMSLGHGSTADSFTVAH